MNEPARSESLDARAWWTLAVVVAVVLIAYLGFSAGMLSTPDDDARSEAGRSAATSDASDDPTVRPLAGTGNGPETEPPDSDSQPLDAQSLREFGELGVLPGLLDDFSSVPDCDFDDALSTCQ